LAYLRQKGDTEKARQVEGYLHSSGWSEARKQHILTRNQQGRTTDAESAPSQPMVALDKAGDFLGKIVGDAPRYLLDQASEFVGAPKTEHITGRDALQSAAAYAGPLTAEVIGATAPLVAKAAPTLTKLATKAASYAPTLSRIAGTGIVGGVNNSAIQGTVGLATGDEEGKNRLQEGLHQAQEAFLPGVAGGAVLGTVGELLVGAANKLAGKVKMPASLAETPPVEPIAPTAGEVPPIAQEMHGGLPIPTGLHADVGSKFEKLASDYVADIRKTQPALHEAVHVAGASPKHALYIKQEVIPWVMEGLDNAQREQFGLQKAANSAFSRAGSAAEDVASAKSTEITMLVNPY
jgi:hypothetical protein